MVATVLAVVVAAAVAGWVDPGAGLAAWTIVLVAATAVFVVSELPAAALVVGIALAAVVQVVAFTLPGRGIDEVWRVGAVAGLVLPAAWLLRARCPLTALPQTRRSSPGIVLLVAATPLLTLAAWQVGGVGHPPDGAVRLLAAVVVAAAAFVEELCFRRVVHVGARAVAGGWAFVLSAVVWASGGAATGDAGTVLLLLGAGLVYGLAYDWLGRWWPGALSHAAVAVLVFVVISPA